MGSGPDLAKVEYLVASAEGSIPSAEEVDYVLELTEGHPLFLVEASRLRSERGPIEKGVQLPRGLLQTLEERLSRIGEATLEVLLTSQGGQGPAPPCPFSLVRTGDIWQLQFGAESIQLPNTKGLELLGRLVYEPNRQWHVLDLVSDRQLVDTGDSGEQLDASARDAYRTRIEELQEELAEAHQYNDLGRAQHLEEEREQLQAQLVSAFGLGGRVRRAGSAAQRARVNVRRRLKDALERIARHAPLMARHVERSLTTGICCCYRP